MINKAMERMLANARIDNRKRDRARDVSSCPQPEPGVYDLTGAHSAEEIESGDFDYCDAKLEEWVWSIGRLPDGRIFAALDTRFYGAPGVTCLWLR